MIKLLAKIGRLNTVIIITLIAVVASLAATMTAVTLLNDQGYALHTEIAAILAACVPLLIAPPIAWFLVDRSHNNCFRRTLPCQDCGLLADCRLPRAATAKQQMRERE